MIKQIVKKGYLTGFLLFLCFSLITAMGIAQSTVKVQLLSPQPNSNVEIDDVILVFSVLQDMEKVKLSGITIELDGIDVSHSVQFNQGVISYLPLDIKLGAHSATLKITDISGKMIKPVVFSFNIIPSTVKYKTKRITPIIRFSGTNGMNYGATDTTGPGASARQQPSSNNNLNITATGAYKGINYEGIVRISSRSSFNSQPSDTYAFKVYTSWGGIRAGDSFPSYSSLVMTGNRVRGASAYTTLDSSIGRIRIDGVYGQAFKRIDYSSTPQRNMQALNASYDLDNTLKVSVIYLNSEDNLEGAEISGAEYYNNTVFGTSVEYVPSYNFNVKMKYAKSDTENIQTNKSADVSATGEAFIGNDAALDSSIYAVVTPFYTFKASYAVTGLNYKSFGNPWKRVDFQKVESTSSFKFFNSKLTFSATVSSDSNNLSENAATTTNTMIYSSNGALRLGTGLPSLTYNYSFNITKSEDLSLSSISANRENTYWSTTLTEMFTLAKVSFTMSANYGENNQDDLINPLYSTERTNYGTGLKLALPNYASLDITFKVVENSLGSTNSIKTTDTLILKASYPLIAQKLTMTGKYQFDKQDDTLLLIDNEKTQLGFTLTWSINLFQRLYASYKIIEYNNILTPDISNYKSNSFNLNYTITFDGFSY